MWKSLGKGITLTAAKKLYIHSELGICSVAGVPRGGGALLGKVISDGCHQPKVQCLLRISPTYTRLDHWLDQSCIIGTRGTGNR